MLKFSDNQNIEHVLDVSKLVHVHVRKSDLKNVTLTLHTLGPHTVPVTVEPQTANIVLNAWENHHVLES